MIYGCNCDLGVTQVDSLVKVFSDSTALPALKGPIEVARGENAALQFVLQAPEDGLSGLRIEKVTLPEGPMKVRTAGPVFRVYSPYNTYWNRDPESFSPADGMFPDPIVPDSTLTLAGGERGSLWLDIDVPVDTKPGNYTVKALICSDKGKSLQKFRIKVYPAAVERQRLLVTNWMGLQDPFINAGEALPDSLQTPMWADLFKMAGEYGNNAWRINHAVLPVKDAQGKIVGWNFEDFDEEVELIMANAPVEQIHGMHFGGRSEWVGHMKFNDLEPDDPALKEWIYSYFPALQEHLEGKKLDDGRSWLDIFAQFIADEPIDFNLDDWKAVAAMIKDAAPRIRTIEAYRSSTLDRSLLDFPVPQLDEFAENGLYNDITREDGVWIYTCMFPRGKYANRFLEQELLKPRLLHWINYKYNAVGYLHWGLNYWWGAPQGDPYGEVSNPGNDWPGGDSHIIYPGYRKLYPSIRYCAMRDGIRDYELLRMVEEKDSLKAREFVDRAVLGYDSYNTDVQAFRALRHDILEFLAK